MKQGWGTKKLSEICEVFADGDWIESKDQSAEGVRLIQTGNIGYGLFKDRNEKARYISETTFNRLRCIEIYEGDCLVSRLPDPVGRACILPKAKEKMITAVDCTIIRFRQKEVLPTWFVYYSLSQEYKKQIDINLSGATRQRINRNNLGQINIPLPPLPEQQHIIAILDEALASISKAKANAEQNLKNAKELFESHLNEVFEEKGDGWEEKSIGEICDLLTGGTPNTKKSEYFTNGEIRWLVSGDVNLGEINDCEGRITELGFSNSNAKYLPINSVIIALNGQGKTRGSVAMLRVKATCNQSLVSIYPKDIRKILPEYIFYNLKNRYQEIRKMTGDSGNDRRGLNMLLIRNIKISYPKSIIKQQYYIGQFSILSSECRKLEAIYIQKIADLEELKKSILQKAFNGELKTSKEAVA